VRQSRGYVRNRLALVAAPEDVQEMVKQDDKTVRAAYYLSDVQEEWIRAELIQGILEKRITGESIPGYLATLREQEKKKQERQSDVKHVSELHTSISSPSDSVASPSTLQSGNVIQQETSLPATVQDRVTTTNGQQEIIVEQPGEQEKKAQA